MKAIISILGAGLACIYAPAQVPPPPAGDPFGDDKSAAVQDVKGRGQENPDPDEDRSAKGSMKKEASFLFRNIHNQTNPGSILTLAVPAMGIPTTSDVLETRVTLSDRFEDSDRFRWLFKGFNSLSSIRGADGRLAQESRLDEGFLDWRGEKWFFSLGKRRINWGHAQAFNPVNAVVPPRDPMDPSRETEGQPMLWMSRTDGPQGFDVILTRNYDRNYVSDGTRWGFRWHRSAAKIDYAVYYFDGQPYPDGRGFEGMAGASFSADVYPGLTVYLETARFRNNYRNYYLIDGSASNKQKPYWQGVVGAGYNFGGRGRLVGEYYHNGQGYGKSELQAYVGTLQETPAGTMGSLARDFSLTAMNRDYALLNYRDEFRERYTLDLTLLAAGDRSVSFRAQAAYALSDYYEASLVVIRNQGSRKSEFGILPVTTTVELRFSAHF